MNGTVFPKDIEQWGSSVLLIIFMWHLIHREDPNALGLRMSIAVFTGSSH
jgi:hypothetical protein